MALIFITNRCKFIRNRGSFYYCKKVQNYYKWVQRTFIAYRCNYCKSMDSTGVTASSILNFPFSLFFSEKSNLEKYLKISFMENDSAHINLTREIAVKCWWVFSNPNEDLPIKVYWRDIPTERQTCGRQKNLFNLILINFIFLAEFRGQKSPFGIIRRYPDFLD